MTCQKAKKDDAVKYHTVAHEFLALNEIPLIATLDDLLTEAATKIKPKRYYELDVPKVIKTIEGIFTLTPIEKKGNVFYIHQNLQEKREILYSALGPLAYTAVAEALNLPFVAVKDLYINIVWNLSKNRFTNWIIVPNRVMNLLDLLDQPAVNSISQFPEQDDVFEDKSVGLDKDKTLALYYNSIGLVWMEKKETRRAVDCFTKSIELNPKSAHAYYYRGMAYDKLGDQEKSFDDISMAFELS